MTQAYGEKEIATLNDFEFAGKTVFCRLDLNVPLLDDEVQDDKRIRATLPTVNHLLENGAKVILASHLGRPKGQVKPQYSLLPVAQHLAELINREVIFPDDCVGSGVRKVLQVQKKSDVVLLENLRFHAEETKNDKTFALELK